MSDDPPDVPVPVARLAEPTLPPVATGKSVLAYATPSPGKQRTVIVARCGTIAESELLSAELAAAGIPSNVVDQNSELLGVYIGGVDVKIMVMAEDAARAAEVLRLSTSEEVEPCDSDETPIEENGAPIPLTIAARFDSAWLLRRAATTLASAGIQPFLPTLVARGDKPAGAGKRFHLRVRDEDLDRAQSLLAEAEEEEADDEMAPRCPRCRSSRIYPAERFFIGVARIFGLVRNPPAAYECLACKYRGSSVEFIDEPT